MSLSSESVVDARDNLPKHVAIIMDGNGRWAQQRGKMRVAGHHAGVKAVRKTVASAIKLGITHLTLFAFSSENWRRPQDEVTGLMELFMMVLNREVKKLHRNGVRLNIIGDTGRFSDSLQKRIVQAQQLTEHNQTLILNVAANYGGRWDIVNAARRFATEVAEGRVSCDSLTEKGLEELLQTAGQPQVDLMIRTGGEHRISNFLLWQLAYAELYFTDTLWPDFGEQAFAEAVADFVGRERRFGCTGEQIRALMNSAD